MVEEEVETGVIFFSQLPCLAVCTRTRYGGRREREEKMKEVCLKMRRACEVIWSCTEIVCCGAKLERSGIRVSGEKPPEHEVVAPSEHELGLK